MTEDTPTGLHEQFGTYLPGAILQEKLPPGWAHFDPDDGEADGREAYIYANGHQVLITENNYVLAYPEQKFIDLMGFVRPLADDGDANPEAVKPPVEDRNARYLALGYMMAISHYEEPSSIFTPNE